MVKVVLILTNVLRTLVPTGDVKTVLEVSDVFVTDFKFWMKLEHALAC